MKHVVLQWMVITHLSRVMGLFNFLLHDTFYGNENGLCVPNSSALGIAREIPMVGYSAAAEYFLFQHSDSGTWWCKHACSLCLLQMVSRTLKDFNGESIKFWWGWTPEPQLSFPELTMKNVKSLYKDRGTSKVRLSFPIQVCGF